MQPGMRLRKALRREEALAHPCPACNAPVGSPCRAMTDGHALKQVHSRRQFPFGMYEPDTAAAVVAPLNQDSKP